MKVLIFSDIHGNILAFEKLLKRHTDIDLYICLGDVVNYGPFSNECVDLLDSLPYDNTIKIKGNHDQAFEDGSYPGTHPVAKAFFEFCYSYFDRQEKISKYQEVFCSFDYCFIHTIGNNYIYSDSDITLDKNYMVGHSHRQFLIENNQHRLYNPGSVGQNRISINLAQYLIFYPEINKVQFESFEYDFDQLFKEMKIRKYPEICLNYYLSKFKKQS